MGVGVCICGGNGGGGGGVPISTRDGPAAIICPPRSQHRLALPADVFLETRQLPSHGPGGISGEGKGGGARGYTTCSIECARSRNVDCGQNATSVWATFADHVGHATLHLLREGRIHSLAVTNPCEKVLNSAELDSRDPVSKRCMVSSAL